MFQGQALGTSDASVPSQLETFKLQLLGFGPDPVSPLVAALEADPDCVYAHASLAMCMMYGETQASPEAAAPHLAAGHAAAAKGTASPREAHMLEAAQAWHDGRSADRATAMQRAHDECPSDVVVAKLLSDAYFWVGDFGLIARGMERTLDASPHEDIFYGYCAFILDQLGRLAEAEQLAVKGIAMSAAEGRLNPWADHALVHVYDSMGRADEIVDVMEGKDDAYFKPEGGLMSYIQTHNYWHLGLAHMEVGNDDRALSLFDDRVWACTDSGAPQDVVHCVAHLWHLELRGVPIGQRWGVLAEALAARSQDRVNPYLDLHMLYAVGRALGEKQQDAMLESVKARAAAPFADERDAANWLDVVVPVADAVVAHSRGDAVAALAALDRANFTPATFQRTLVRLGGSHPQREVFERMYAELLLRQGRYGDAAHVLDARIARKSGHVFK